MFRMRFAALGLVPLLLAGPARGIALNQVDDFEDGSVQGWDEGDPSPNPPTNLGSGGPGGADDNYMRLTSTGAAGAGGRMVVFNEAQWRGNFNSANVTAVRAEVRAFAGTANLRVGVERNGCRWVSTVAAVVTSDGQWHTVTFDLTQMTRVLGSCSRETALDSVSTFRLISSQGVAWQGDVVSMTLGVDDITALETIVPVEPVSWGGIKVRNR